LHYAVHDSKKEIAQALLGLGCNPDAEDEYGCTALLYAAQNGSHDIVDLLIKSNCNKDVVDEVGISVKKINEKFFQHGCTALHKATYFGHIKVVKLLLHAGCKYIQDRKGITPLKVAEYWNRTDIIKLLQPHENDDNK